MVKAAEGFKREIASHAPHLPIKDAGHWTIMLEHLEFAIETEKLDCIARLHNEGDTPLQISKFVCRYYPEVMLALMHLALRGRLTRPIAFVQ